MYPLKAISMLIILLVISSTSGYAQEKVSMSGIVEDTEPAILIRAKSIIWNGLCLNILPIRIRNY